MEFQGTKGKWEVKDNYVFSEDNKSIAVCQQMSFKYDKRVRRINDTEYSYNAKLIASAPEMFEILKESQKTIQSLIMSMSAHPDCEEDSEFADYVSLAYEQETKIKQLLTKITEQ